MVKLTQDKYQRRAACARGSSVSPMAAKRAFTSSASMYTDRGAAIGFSGKGPGSDFSTSNEGEKQEPPPPHVWPSPPLPSPRMERPLKPVHQVVDSPRLDIARGILPNRQRLEMRLPASDLGRLIVAQVVNKHAAFGLDNEIQALFAADFNEHRPIRVVGPERCRHFEPRRQ